MITKGIEVILIAALMSPAQTAEPVKTAEIVQGSLIVGLSGVGAAERRPVDEQIEVMRALLLRKLGHGDGATYSWTYDTYPTQAQTSSQASPQATNALTSYMAPSLYGSLTAIAPSGAYQTGLRPASVEGTYLTGYGVILNATVIGNNRDPRPGAEPKKSTPDISEWERVQRQLRGERVSEASQPAAKEPPLGDVLLKLIAQNGKNFSALKDDEKVTVVVTFRSAGATSRSSFNSAVGGTGLSGQYQPSVAPANLAHGQSAHDLTLLAELHHKQGQVDQAAENYRKAIAAAEKEANEPAADEADVAKSIKRRADLYAKYSLTLISAGKFDAARESLEKARELQSRNTTTAKTSSPKSTPIALPARLTISASKHVLDQVGSGAMDFEEFRKAAKIDYTPASKVAD